MSVLQKDIITGSEAGMLLKNQYLKVWIKGLGWSSRSAQKLEEHYHMFGWIPYELSAYTNEQTER